MITAPIWQDTNYQTSSNTLSYTISVNGVEVFKGKAFKKPNADYLYVNINKICQNYLSNELPLTWTSGGTFTNTEAVKDFVLKNDGGTTLETYRFYYDWSYGESWGVINGHYASGQKQIVTTTGTSYYSNFVQTIVGASYCGEYAIYYLDCQGKWQSFLFEGKCRKYDNYNSYEYNRSFNNTTIEFEQGRYISEIQTTYELSTGWLNDSQSANFARNLVGTNMAYLHNLKTGKIVPVLIDMDSIQYKKYKDDNHLVEYTINVKESQNRIRK